jgi:hypothetical protein
MGAWSTARLLPELSNFYCLPGRAGGSPWVTSLAARVSYFVTTMKSVSRPVSEPRP